MIEGHRGTARTVAVALALATALGCAQGVIKPKIAVSGVGYVDELGTSLARLSQVGGPGALAFGAPGTGALGIVRLVDPLTGADLYTRSGGSSNTLFGFRVASAGDTDSDGFDDLLVSAAIAPASNGNNVAHLYSGGTGLLRFSIGPDVLGDSNAFALAGVGDVTGDGIADFAVAGVGTNWGQVSVIGTPVAGRVRVFNGATGAMLYRLTDNVPGSGFGWAVAALGDVDGDGVSDFAVGVPYAGGTATPVTRPGQVSVYSGWTGTFLWNLVPPSGAYYSLGLGIDAIGDVNGDGVADLVVRYWVPNSPSPNYLGAGSLAVYSGASGAILWQVGGIACLAACGAGDVNGDGVPDVAASVVAVAGVNAGTYPGGVVFFDGASGTSFARIDGLATGTNFGASLSHAGDVDGDGFAEILLGAPYTPVGLAPSHAGAAYLCGLGGAQPYGPGGAQPQAPNSLSLQWSRVAASIGLVSVAGGAPLTGGFTAVSLAPANLATGGGGVILVDPNQLLPFGLLPYTTAPSGATALATVDLRTPGLAFTEVFLQCIEATPSTSAWPFALSNGLDLQFVP